MYISIYIHATRQVALVQAELSIAQTELFNRKLGVTTVHPSLPSASQTNQMINDGALPQTVDHSLWGLPPPLLLPMQQPQHEEEKDGDNSIMDGS
jgi:LOB domain-containing protein 18